MISAKAVSQQLRRVGCNYTLWGRTEVGELASILMDDEQILQAVNGYYDGGFALLCTTNYRVLLVDKKPLALTVEDLRYDMIAEVDYGSRIITSVLHIYTPLRTLDFTSWSMDRLRNSMNYIQQRVMELRNNDFLSTQFANKPTTSPIQTWASRTPVAQRIPQMLPRYKNTDYPPAEFEARVLSKTPVNPYTKVPLLSRRRRYPSFY